MVSPDGLVGSCRFLPSVAEVKKWLEDAERDERIRNAPKALPRPHPEHRLLPPEREWRLSPEEKARRDAVWAETKKKLKMATLEDRMAGWKGDIDALVRGDVQGEEGTTSEPKP